MSKKQTAFGETIYIFYVSLKQINSSKYFPSLWTSETVLIGLSIGISSFLWYLW